MKENRLIFKKEQGPEDDSWQDMLDYKFKQPRSSEYLKDVLGDELAKDLKDRKYPLQDEAAGPLIADKDGVPKASPDAFPVQTHLETINEMLGETKTGLPEKWRDINKGIIGSLNAYIDNPRHSKEFKQRVIDTIIALKGAYDLLIEKKEAGTITKEDLDAFRQLLIDRPRALAATAREELAKVDKGDAASRMSQELTGADELPASPASKAERAAESRAGSVISNTNKLLAKAGDPEAAATAEFLLGDDTAEDTEELPPADPVSFREITEGTLGELNDYIEDQSYSQDFRNEVFYLVTDLEVRYRELISQEEIVESEITNFITYLNTETAALKEKAQEDRDREIPFNRGFAQVHAALFGESKPLHEALSPEEYESASGGLMAFIVRLSQSPAQSPKFRAKYKSLPADLVTEYESIKDQETITASELNFLLDETSGYYQQIAREAATDQREYFEALERARDKVDNRQIPEGLPEYTVFNSPKPSPIAFEVRNGQYFLIPSVEDATHAPFPIYARGPIKPRDILEIVTGRRAPTVDELKAVVRRRYNYIDPGKINVRWNYDSNSPQILEVILTEKDNDGSDLSVKIKYNFYNNSYEISEKNEKTIDPILKEKLTQDQIISAYLENDPIPLVDLQETEISEERQNILTGLATLDYIKGLLDKNGRIKRGYVKLFAIAFYKNSDDITKDNFKLHTSALRQVVTHLPSLDKSTFELLATYFDNDKEKTFFELVRHCRVLQTDQESFNILLGLAGNEVYWDLEEKPFDRVSQRLLTLITRNPNFTLASPQEGETADAIKATYKLLFVSALKQKRRIPVQLLLYYQSEYWALKDEEGLSEDILRRAALQTINRAIQAKSRLISVDTVNELMILVAGDDWTLNDALPGNIRAYYWQNVESVSEDELYSLYKSANNFASVWPRKADTREFKINHIIGSEEESKILADLKKISETIDPYYGLNIYMRILALKEGEEYEKAMTPFATKLMDPAYAKSNPIEYCSIFLTNEDYLNLKDLIPALEGEEENRKKIRIESVIGKNAHIALNEIITRKLTLPRGLGIEDILKYVQEDPNYPLIYDINKWLYLNADLPAVPNLLRALQTGQLTPQIISQIVNRRADAVELLAAAGFESMAEEQAADLIKKAPENVKKALEHYYAGIITNKRDRRITQLKKAYLAIRSDAETAAIDLPHELLIVQSLLANRIYTITLPEDQGGETLNILTDDRSWLYQKVHGPKSNGSFNQAYLDLWVQAREDGHEWATGQAVVEALMIRHADDVEGFGDGIRGHNERYFIGGSLGLSTEDFDTPNKRKLYFYIIDDLRDDHRDDTEKNAALDAHIRTLPYEFIPEDDAELLMLYAAEPLHKIFGEYDLETKTFAPFTPASEEERKEYLWRIASYAGTYLNEDGLYVSSDAGGADNTRYKFLADHDIYYKAGKFINTPDEWRKLSRSSSTFASDIDMAYAMIETGNTDLLTSLVPGEDNQTIAEFIAGGLDDYTEDMNKQRTGAVIDLFLESPEKYESTYPDLLLVVANHPEDLDPQGKRLDRLIELTDFSKNATILAEVWEALHTSLSGSDSGRGRLKRIAEKIITNTSPDIFKDDTISEEIRWQIYHAHLQIPASANPDSAETRVERETKLHLNLIEPTIREALKAHNDTYHLETQSDSAYLLTINKGKDNERTVNIELPFDPDLKEDDIDYNPKIGLVLAGDNKTVIRIHCMVNFGNDENPDNHRVYTDLILGEEFDTGYKVIRKKVHSDPGASEEENARWGIETFYSFTWTDDGTFSITDEI